MKEVSKGVFIQKDKTEASPDKTVGEINSERIPKEVDMIMSKKKERAKKVEDSIEVILESTIKEVEESVVGTEPTIEKIEDEPIIDNEQGTEAIEDNWDEGPNRIEVEESGGVDQLTLASEELANMTDPEAIKAKIQELLRARVVTKRVIGSAIDRINNSDSIAEIRKAIKVGHAKKAKTPKEKVETLARYEEEIKLGKAKLNELIVAAGGESNPTGLLKMGEEVSKVAQAWVIQQEEELKAKIADLGGFTENDNLTAKFKLSLQNRELYEFTTELENKLRELHPDLVTLIGIRLKNQDKRVENVVRMYNFIQMNGGGAEKAE